MELKGKSSRIQSSLGSKLVESNDSVISTLLIARVKDVNYQENYVIFVPITTNSTSRPATRGTNQALLPSEFAGRNGFGRSYGVINPIHVGDIVLIGLLESDAAKPIVISRYPDTKIASELTDQASQHYEPADFSNYATANKRTIVYPDQGYNIHDGRGNLTLKFSGNTFMLVRPDVPIVSHATDDGDTPINAQNIPGNSDGSGQPRNAMVQNAPEVIYGHRGNINKDGTKDNHAYYVYIGQDGDYRVSMMQDDQDWRTYFEETPDGQIRLRRQEDSKIFGTGSKSSEFLIDNNGYVTIRSQSTGLVLKPDGIYNLDGTKFTVDTDLSGVWDAITKTQNGVKENKAQITVNANEIATKVSTDELPDAINEQLKPYDDSLKSLQDSYTDVQKTIDNLASDGIISGTDKKATRTIWLQIQTEYPATVAQAEANGVDHSSLDTSYNTLSAYLEPILSAGGDTTVDPTEWGRNFSNYYNASFNVNTAVVAALRKLAQSGYDKAVQAGLDAGSAITQASEASSEDYLTGSDKATLNHIWVQIQNQYPNDVASANTVSVDHSALDAAYNDLSNYITSNNIFADSSTIAIDGSALADKIKAYFSQEATVLKQVADKNIQTLAQYGEDINHQATAIKETSTKIALSAENIQKQGDSLSTMQGQLDIMANQISGGVSETDVSGIVNDSLSGTELGSTNQFVINTATKGQYMNGNNGTSASSPNGIISDYIVVKASSAYTGKVYGATGTTKLSVAWYDSTKKFISGTEVSGTSDFTNSGTSPSNASYAKVSMDNYNFNTLFISGIAPDTWAPSYADAKSNASDANILLKSLTSTQAAIASSINANSNKNTANVSSIDSMFAGGNLGSTDIGTLKAILADSGTDNASDNSLATQYGVDISALNNYYSQLQADINGILSQDEGTTVDVDSYKAKLSAYYNGRDTFLKAVKGKLDGQVSSAQESLANANNTVQEVITNKYANFAVTVNGISTKVGEVSETANNASTAASAAQGTADTASSAASAAQSDLDGFKTTTTNKFSEIDQTADGIKQSVSAVTTIANNASDKINNLQVGGTNYILDSGFESGKIPTMNWGTGATGQTILSTGGSTFPVPFGKYMLKIDSDDSSTTLNQYVSFKLPNVINLLKGETWTMSYEYSSAGAANGQASDYMFDSITSSWVDGLMMGHSTRVNTKQGDWHTCIKTLTVTANISISDLRFGFVKTSSTGHGWVCIDNIKLEKGNTPTAWSPAPADNASASDLATTNQTVKTVQTQTANNWSVLAEGIGGTSAGISVDGSGTVTISGDKLVIGSDFIAGNITGKTISGSIINGGVINGGTMNSPTINVPFTHASIDSSGILSTGKLSLNGTSYTIDGTIEDTNGNPDGQVYHTEVNPDGFLSYITQTDGTTQMHTSRISMGVLELTDLVSGLGTSAKYITSDFNAHDAVDYYHVDAGLETANAKNINITYSRHGSLVNVGFDFDMKDNNAWKKLADIRPGYKPFGRIWAQAIGNTDVRGAVAVVYAQSGGWYMFPSLGNTNNYHGTFTFTTQDDYPTGDVVIK